MINQGNTKEFSIDIIYAFKLLYKWKWPLIIVCLIAGLATYFFTGKKFITPQYKAYVVFYPTTNINISSSLLSEPGINRYDILEFGSDDEAEQILQILQSDDIRNKAIDHFDLATAYEMYNEDGTKSYLALRSKLNKNLIVRQTEFKAIEIVVYDHDPVRAAAMANFIGEEADRIKNSIQKAKAKKVFEIIGQEYKDQRAMMDSMEKNLMKLREYGLYDYFEQSSQLNEIYSSMQAKLQQETAMLKVYEENKSSLPDTTIIRTKARVQGYQAAINMLKPKLEVLSKYGGKYLENWNNLDVERKKISTLKLRFESAKLDLESALPQNFIINKAEVPEVPSKPRRLLTTAIVMISAFMLSAIIIFILDYFALLKKRVS